MVCALILWLALVTVGSSAAACHCSSIQWAQSISDPSVSSSSSCFPPNCLSLSLSLAFIQDGVTRVKDILNLITVKTIKHAHINKECNEFICVAFFSFLPATVPHSLLRLKSEHFRFRGGHFECCATTGKAHTKHDGRWLGSI